MASNATVQDKILAVVQAIIYYHVSPDTSNLGKFAGSKERIRLALKQSHQNLQVFTKFITQFCGVKEECLKRGLGDSFEVKLCRLVKDQEGSKAFSINTQEQWEMEMPPLLDSDTATSLQGESLFF